MSDDDNKRPEDPPKGKPKGRPPLKLVDPDESAPRLLDAHRDDLRASGLSDETIELAGLYTESRGAQVARILGRRSGPAVAKLGPCLVFPFRKPGDEAPHTARVKPSRPRTVTQAGGKRRTVKYDQCSDDGLLVYWTPRAMRDGVYADPARPLVLTEGEKKSLLLDQLGYAVVGLTGVWNWLDKTTDEAETGRLLHPEIREHCALMGRDVVIVYDADATTNDEVMLAARQLAGCLQAAGARHVRFTCPPDARAKQGIDDFAAEHGEQATRDLVDKAPEIDRPINPKNPLPKVTDYRALRSAPVKKGLRVPDGYNVRKDGSLWALNPDPEKPDKVVALGVILIAGYRRDLETGEHRVELVFQKRGRWHTVVVDARATVDRTPMLTELAPHLAPVTSNTASAVIDWFAAFKQANEDLLPEVVSVRRLGWAEIASKPAFVLDVPLAAGGQLDRVVVDDRGENRKILEALKPRGTYDAHIAALRKAWSASNTCALMICASLAPPLLELLEAPNFGLHLFGDSSKGKSSIIGVAGSIWGDPNPGGAWIASWSATWVGAEIRAAMLSGLPLCFDEVGATDMRTLERMVYMLVNGGGKTRGTEKVALRETMTWRTILLSTGEHPLAGEQANTGAQVRILSRRVVGFGDLTGADIEALRTACADNRGQVGRRWIQQILDTKPDVWERIRVKMREWIATIRERCKGNTLAQRQAVYFGFLAVIEDLAEQALGLGKPGGATMIDIATSSEDRQDVRPVFERARDLVESWMASSPATFPKMVRGYDGEDEAGDKSASERLINGYHREDGAVVFVPDQLNARLAAAGMNSDEVLRGWRDHGWLDCEPGGRLTKAVRGIPGTSKRPRMYVVRFPDD